MHSKNVLLVFHQQMLRLIALHICAVWWYRNVKLWKFVHWLLIGCLLH